MGCRMQNGAKIGGSSLFNLKPKFDLRLTNNDTLQGLKSISKGNRLPSEHLSQLIYYATAENLTENNNFHNDLFDIWLNALPTEWRSILDAEKISWSYDMKKVAQKADVMQKYDEMQAAKRSSESTLILERLGRMENLLREMKEMLDSMNAEMKGSKAVKQQRGRSKSRRRRSSSRCGGSHFLCYYHDMWGKEARKCIPGCVYY
ncbi:Hypothetical predicted protein [Cloeon dipterum]|uniref:Uncharacterized protein n=1 Tax=Cloeon dipterum TaxID=197152 RepID=A0A8S1D483_9INSE|nr:Hypothetical predicted protein [Cloeon dipterum]